MNPAPPRALRAEAIIEIIEALRNGDPGGALVFDADGTLWSGDVGEEAFLHAVDQGLLRDECLPYLEQQALAHGLSTSGSPAHIAKRLYEAYLAGTYSELSACEMMVLCYAGWTVAELRAHTLDALALSHSRVKAFAPLLRIIHWARARNLRCIIVSASPKFVVEEAAAPLGFRSDDVLAGHALCCEERIDATLAAPIPYASAKVQAAYSVLAGTAWLATFGDNAFDMDMLQAAKLPVLVRPKQRLLDLVGHLEDPVALADD